MNQHTGDRIATPSYSIHKSEHWSMDTYAEALVSVLPWGDLGSLLCFGVEK